MREGSKEITKPYNPAEEAVADAMMLAQAQTIKPILKNPRLINKSTNPTEQMEKKIEELSLGKCRQASVFALTYLVKRHFNLFEKMLLISASQGDGISFRNPKQRFHVFFLLKIKQAIGMQVVRRITLHLLITKVSNDNNHQIKQSS